MARNTQFLFTICWLKSTVDWKIDTAYDEYHDERDSSYWATNKV